MAYGSSQFSVQGGGQSRRLGVAPGSEQRGGRRKCTGSRMADICMRLNVAACVPPALQVSILRLVLVAVSSVLVFGL